MKFMLDTNICIYIIKQKPSHVIERFIQTEISQISISSITLSELTYGVSKSSKPTQNQIALAQFIAPLEIIPNGLYTESAASYNPEDMSKIKVVPNPYRGTALFESRYEDKIMFTNLPPACKIQIFTINGDLVDTIYHDSGDKMEVWELITRNQQKVVSGLYLYTVEIEEPESEKIIGKFVIIR